MLLKFLSIYKPVGISSFKALSSIKRYFDTTKVGHLGTLDVLAEGILGVAVGKATRLIQYVESEPKKYQVEITFGFETPSFDAEGLDLSVVWQNLEKVDFSEAALKEALMKLKAQEWQLPPIYSAVKVKGKRAYELARQGLIAEADLKYKQVSLNSFRILEFNLPKVRIELESSSGYYVRSLVRDLALELNVKAFMSQLARLQVGVFNVENASELVDSETIKLAEIPLSQVIKDYREVVISESGFRKLTYGQQVGASEASGEMEEGGLVFVRLDDKVGWLAKIEDGRIYPLINLL